MHRMNAEMEWYLRHEWERRLRRAEWGGDVPTERTAVRRGRKREQP